MRDHHWFVPSILLTLVSGAAALLAIPNPSGLLPALSILPAWLAAAAIIAGLYGFGWAASNGVPDPLARLKTLFREQRERIQFVALVILFAGLNMIAFMWVKPLLNYLVPFWADPLLADWDKLLFFGHEPWQVLQWANFPAAGIAYHPGWFAMMILALLIAAWAPPSPERSALLLAYFVLWSLAGPLIHVLLPAGGPIFYERMGYGTRFAALDGGAETMAVADYLWSVYASKSFGAGSGISAMPSMHVTMSTWTAIAFAVCARRWLPLGLGALALIFVLSIALGWHYALDGVVGAAAAGGCYFGLRAVFRARAHQSEGRASPALNTPAS